jgi:Phosphotransferase enzyme family
VIATLKNSLDVAEIGAALVGWPVASVTAVRRGGNNRVYLLSGSGENAALKFYPRQVEDRRDRLSREFAALSFLRRHGIDAVPRPLACDPVRSCAAYEWIEGTDPTPVGPADIDALADFFLRLQRLHDAAGAEALGAASASCLSPAMIIGQLESRLARLRAAIMPGTEIADFVAGPLQAAAGAVTARLRRDSQCAYFAAPLPRMLQTLSASDFGFHNALRRPDGSLAFIDFEYFGWDDPAKAVADVMLHAGMALPDDLARRYRVRVAEALASADPGFADRLDRYFPAMVVLWCLIMLNEFVPERWTRRTLAGQRDSCDIVQAKQLQRARALLARNFS